MRIFNQNALDLCWVCVNIFIEKYMNEPNYDVSNVSPLDPFSNSNTIWGLFEFHRIFHFI